MPFPSLEMFTTCGLGGMGISRHLHHPVLSSNFDSQNVELSFEHLDAEFPISMILYAFDTSHFPTQSSP